MGYREARLNGIRAAAEVQENLGISSYIREKSLNRIDIFEAITSLGITTLCRPLDGLLGAYYKKGILVTTNRRLPIQRFTAAHELGHCWLKHDQSLDTEASIKSARESTSNAPLQEVEAEAFASEFLLPKALVVLTAKRLGWGKKDLKISKNIYQLSLRLCTSYEATCRAIYDHDLITNLDLDKLLQTRPKQHKEELLGGHNVDNYHLDVFHLTDKDSNSSLLASSEDFALLDLVEHTTGGYLWSEINSQSRLTITSDERIAANIKNIGATTQRSVLFSGEKNVEIELKEIRLWDKEQDPINSFEIKIDFSGKEEGLPRAARR